MPDAHLLHRREIDEIGGADVIAVGRGVMVADEVPAEIAARRFDVREYFAFGHAERIRFFARHRFAVRNVFDGLLQNFDGLADFLNAAPHAVINVAVCADGNVEIETVVNRIGVGAANIIFHARTAQHGTRNAIIHCEVGRQYANVFCAHIKNFVLDEIRFHFIRHFGQTIVRQFARDFEPPFRQISPHAAKAHVIAHHARTGRGLE